MAARRMRLSSTRKAAGLDDVERDAQAGRQTDEGARGFAEYRVRKGRGASALSSSVRAAKATSCGTLSQRAHAFVPATNRALKQRRFPVYRRRISSGNGKIAMASSSIPAGAARRSDPARLPRWSATGALGGSRRGAVGLAVHQQMNPAADTLALSSIEVERHADRGRPGDHREVARQAGVHPPPHAGGDQGGRGGAAVGAARSADRRSRVTDSAKKVRRSG